MCHRTLLGQARHLTPRSCLPERLDRANQFHFRAAFQIERPLREFQVLQAWPAAAVAPAEGEQAGANVRVLRAPSSPITSQYFRIGGIAVAVDQLGQDLAAVEALPGEDAVGELVAAVVGPVDFRRGEVFHAAASHNLRHLPGIAEHIRQPKQLALDAKLLAEEPLAVDELANQRLAAGDIRVRLDPGGAVGDDRAVGDSLLDPLVQFRI